MNASDRKLEKANAEDYEYHEPPQYDNEHERWAKCGTKLKK
ncbi:MAG: hypothetical protein PHS46_07825 [Candidatus Omnitrophica bacterium]|nr:hypothetical protein [Candidatus Omnitrophota bacterium]